MKKVCLALMLVATMVGSAWAEEVKLFKDYYYGMPKADVKKMSKAIPCEDSSLQGSLCMPSAVSFAKQKWEQAFVIQDEKLASVLLAKIFKEDAMMPILGAIVNNGFSLLAITSPKGILDVAQVIRQKGQKAVPAELTNFERISLPTGEINYCFFEDSKVGPIIKDKNAQNLGEIVAAAPIGMRSVEIKRKGTLLAIQFLAPIAAAKDMGNEVKSSKESF